MLSNMYLTPGTVLLILCIVALASFVAFKVVRGQRDAFTFGGPQLGRRRASSTAPRAGSTRSRSHALRLRPGVAAVRRPRHRTDLPYAAMGWAGASSASNYVFNHIGIPPARGESRRGRCSWAACRDASRLAVRVPRGRRGWGATSTPSSSGTGRSATATRSITTTPRTSTVKQLTVLFGEYGSKRYRADRPARGRPALLSLSDEEPTTLDEFARCGSESIEDIRDCSPALLFRLRGRRPAHAPRSTPAIRRRAPQAHVRSDIGHWDVPDIREVLPEAWELVEHGHIDEEVFCAFHVRERVRAVAQDRSAVRLASASARRPGNP